MFRDYPPAIQILATILLGCGIITAGLSLMLVMLPLLYDYRIDHGRLKIVVLFFVTIASFDVSRFENVRLVERGDLRMFAFNPFRTLRLGNRIRRQRVVIERRGIIKNLILTPKNPTEFVSQISQA